ncbi:MAG: FAD:protein FMN transferase [Butyrivibrio sp.]|nr:FAD:protein FMN transferase [Butyrivibrio sp.]
MDTVMELEINGDEALLRDAEGMIRSIEKDLSVTDENSSISRLNREKYATLSGDAAKILQGALEVCDRTDGSLDISVYPVLRAWGFTTSSYMVPSDDEIKELLTGVDYSIIETKENTDGSIDVSIADNAEVDLGSVTKGYTGSVLSAYLKDKGVKSALLNLGGNVECIGRKTNGEKWKVAVKSPFEDSKSGILGVYAAEDEAVITSGGYERYFEENGEKYWHILDPHTGKPARSGLSSVTVIGENGLVCDGLSTALFVKGLDEAIGIWRASEDFEAVFVTEERGIYVTEGIAADFKLSPEYSDLAVNVVSRQEDR